MAGMLASVRNSDCGVNTPPNQQGGMVIRELRGIYSLIRVGRISTRHQLRVNEISEIYSTALIVAMGGKPVEYEFNRYYEDARERWIQTGDTIWLERMTAMMVCTCGHPEYRGVNHDVKGCTTKQF